MNKIYGFIGFGILIILIAWAFYLFEFGFCLSTESSSWGQFGDYMSTFVSIASLIVLSSLTIIISKNEERRHEENKMLDEAKIRPIIIFKDIGGKWACKNVGEGAALNIMIAYKINKDLSWENPVKIYSMIPHEEFPIEWKKYGIAQWIATYNDIRENTYTSTCEDDDTKYVIGKNELGNVNDYKRLEEVKRISFD